MCSCTVAMSQLSVYIVGGITAAPVFECVSQSTHLQRWIKYITLIYGRVVFVLCFFVFLNLTKFLFI